jgi:SAM-dependent methyltransferase
MPAPVRHPLFARVFAAMTRYDDATGMAEHRAEMLAGAAGRAVEVGAGSGANFRHYPASVVEVVAVEPEPYLRARAEEAAAVAPPRVTVLDGSADRLPFDDASFDVAVASLVLCSVDDPAVALTEMLRVVRPGGELRFYEHVRAPSPSGARWQERADVVWPHLFGGCHTSRDTVAAIESAGWEVLHRRDLRVGPARVSTPVTPHVVGRARRPA